MIGQTKLIEQLNKFDFLSLPQTILFVGEEGCGKHTVVSMLTAKFNVKLNDITKKLNYEQITEFFLNSDPCIYLIDGTSTISSNEQNALLKFIEEPPTFCKIFLLAENENSFLDTIIGRCTKFKFDRYSLEELKNFTNDEFLLNICKTPGQIKQFDDDNKWVFKLCDTILQKIDCASIPNVLTISNKFNFGKDENNFNIMTFMKLLLYYSLEYSINNTEKDYTKIYLIISSFYDKMKMSNVDKQKLFEECLFEIKRALKL